MFKVFITGFLAFWGIFCGCPNFDKSCNDCHSFQYKSQKIGEIPDMIHESSGLILIEDLFLSHGDSGNEPFLFGFKYPFDTDSIQGILDISGNVNTDWEDLAYDEDRFIFIGDFGNNNNRRTDLNIIKYNLKDNHTELLHFNFHDQKQFPPQKLKDQNFDCEAMFWHKGHLYLFSKNKTSKFTKVYKISDNEPFQQIAPMDSIRLRNTQVTSADINPDNTEVALLAYGKVIFFSIREDESGNLAFSPESCKRLRRYGQAEAILYLDKEHLMITNEKGKVFLVSRKYIESGKKNMNKPEQSLPDIIEGRN